MQPLICGLLGGVIVRVATVGDSLTAAASRCNVNEPWPTLLGKRGEYAVRNFAFAGASEETTAEAYQRSDQLSSMAAFNPEIVTVMLGTFDADRANWRQEDYMISMRTLIHQFQTLPTLPHVVLMVPPPLFVDGASGLSADIVADRLPDAVIRLAHQYGCSLVDLRTPFQRVLGADWVEGTGHAFTVSCDGCHLSAVGHQLVRDAVHNFLGGVHLISAHPRMPPPSSAKTKAPSGRRSRNAWTAARTLTAPSPSSH